MRTLAQRAGLIAWLTLVVSLGITGDLVIDLVFEEPDLSTTADGSSIPEEPDNVAEHILMPSQKAEGSSEALYSGVVTPAAASLLSTCLPSPATTRAGPTHERPPRSSPIPLLLPLRI